MLQEIVSPAGGTLPVIVGPTPSEHGASVDTLASTPLVSLTSNVDGGAKVTVCSPDISGVNSVGDTAFVLTAKDNSSTPGQLGSLGGRPGQLADTDNKTVPELGEGSCGGKVLVGEMLMLPFATRLLDLQSGRL